MEARRRRTKVTVVTGMLDAGKTTFIRNALLFESGRKKSEGLDEKRSKKEKIAILVNEFGSLGIDGAVLEAAAAKKGGGDDDEDSSIYVKEIPGGCVCCAASGSMPFLVAIKNVLEKVKPDRLVIEPSGLAHPSGLYDLFTKNEHLKEHVDLRGMVCVVDARAVGCSSLSVGKEEEEEAKRVRESDMFRDQVSMSEVLVGSKLDLCSGVKGGRGGDEEEEEAESFARRRFREWAASLYPEKRAVKFAMDLFDENAETSPFVAIDREATSSHDSQNSSLKSSSLEKEVKGISRPFQLLALTPPVEPGAKPHLSTHDTEDYSSRGFLFHPDDIFRRDKVLEFFQSRCAPQTKNEDEQNEAFRLVRAKAVVRVSDKTWVIPSFEECESKPNVILEEVAYRKDSRFEIIASKTKAEWSKEAEKEFWADVETRILLCRRC